MIDLRAVGGTLLDIGSRKDWNFGWIPPSERTRRQRAIHEALHATMPKFSLPGKVNEDIPKIDITDLWKHRMVTEALGEIFTGTHQYTGSCVGAGGGNVMFSVNVVEAVEKVSLEKIVVPFWLLPYGRSRFYFGDTSPGEGSMGSTFAKAGEEDGTTDARMAGLPKFDTKDGYSWYENAEMSWSDGDARQTMDLLPETRKHTFRMVKQVQTVDEVEQGIRALRPFTIACSLIPESPRIEDDGECYGRVQRSGGHQTTLQGTWRHPKKGLMFKYQNQWGYKAWGKEGACWIPAADVLAMIKDGEECYMWDLWDGYLMPTFHWVLP